MKDGDDAEDNDDDLRCVHMDQYETLRKGQIRDGKRYLGNGATQRVKYRDGEICDDEI